MKSSSRDVLFFDLLVDTNKQAASPPALRDILPVIENSVGTDYAKMAINKGSATVEVKAINVDPATQSAVFLLRIADKAAADPHFIDIEADTSRVARKEAGEGRGFAAHLCVSLIETSVGSCRYLALLERARGLSSSIVTRLLQSVIREQYQEDGNLFTCPDINGARTRDGSPKLVGFRPMLSLEGLPSDEFLKDLSAGRLRELELIELKQHSPFDATPWLEERSVSVKLGITSAVPKGLPGWNAIRDLIKRKSADGFKQARVKFIHHGGRQDYANINAETGDLMDNKYIKTETISDIVPPMTECSDSIVPHFCAELRSLLVANRPETA